MRLIYLVFLTAVALLADAILVSEFPGSALRPNFLLVPLAAAVIRWPGPTAVFWGALIGLVGDCLAGPNLGPQMALFGLLAAIGSLFIPERPLTGIEIVLFSFGFTLTCMAFSSLLRATLGGPPLAIGSAAQTAMSTALLMGILWIIRRRFVTRSPGGRTRRTASIGWQRDAG